MKFIAFIFGVLTTLIYLIVFGIIISKNFVFSGQLTLNYDFEHESPFISLLKPRGRVDQHLYKDSSGDYYQTLHIDPVYFDVELPRHFKQADVTLTYKNDYESLVELGLSRGEDDEHFLLKPLENKLLDKLISEQNWYSVRDGDRLLLQKEPVYSSISSFLSNLPSDAKIATYNFYLPSQYKINNYKPLSGLHIAKSLRGPHSMLTYVGKDQDLDFTFNFQDVNRGNNKDTIKIRVFKYDQEIYTTELTDDNINDDSAFMSRPFDYNLHIKQPGEAVYRIKIETTDDIFIRDITAIQHLLVFENQVYLGDNVGYLNEKYPSRYEKTNLVTSTEKLSAITSHKEAFQTVVFGDKKIDVDEKHIMFTKAIPLSQRSSLLAPVLVPKNDIKIIGKGFYAFNDKHFFDPSYLNLTGDPNLNLNLYKVKYIIASYEPPLVDGDWHKKTVSFSLDALRDIDNQYRFVISFPYSKRAQTILDVSDITINLKSEPIGIHEFLQKSFNRIKLFLKS